MDSRSLGIIGVALNAASFIIMLTTYRKKQVLHVISLLQESEKQC